MTIKRISAIIPTYNRASMVVEAVESVLAQTYPPAEIIVVDDGSCDDTQERLARFGTRIIVVHQANRGVAEARNTGIRRATGELVAFLDSDDFWHCQKLERQVACLEAHPNAALVACRVGKLREGPAQCRGPLVDAAKVVCWQVPLDRLVKRGCIATSGIMVRRSCLEEVGSFDSELPPAEDRDMWIRIGSRFEIQKQEIDLTFERLGEHDHICEKPVSTETSTKRMIEKVFREVPELRGKSFLKRQALSVAAQEAGILYTQTGQHSAAIKRVMQSLLLWPLPRGVNMDARIKSLVVLGLRASGLRGR